MENVPVFVGLDYHSKSVQVCVVNAEGTVLVNRKCGNSVLEIGNGGWPDFESVRRVPLPCRL